MIEVFTLIAGLALLIVSSSKAVESSGDIAKALKVSPLIIGIVVVGIGTSLPEISTSITSSAMGHGNINAGNNIGSCLANITLIFGLTMMIGGAAILIKNKQDIILISACTTVAAMAAVFIIEKGAISRINAVFLILLYFILMFIVVKYTKKEYLETSVDHGRLSKFPMLIASLIGLVIASVVIVDSIVALSANFQVSEYATSFFALALGTSLPELAFGITALRKREHELVIGDILGSNITNATIGLGAGPLIAPNIISKGIALSTGLYLIIATLIVAALLIWRRRVGYPEAVSLIGLYLASFLLF